MKNNIGRRFYTQVLTNIVYSALIACLFRWKQGALDVKKVLPAIFSGCAAAALFSLAGLHLNTELLKKAFGLLLLFTGIRELRYRPREP